MNRILHLGVLASLVMALDPCAEPPLTDEEAAGCPPPTYERCVNPQNRCDRYFHAQAKLDPKAACSLQIQQATNAGFYAQPPNRTTLKPDRIYGTGLMEIGADTGKAQVQVTQASIYPVEAQDQAVSGKLTAQGLTGSYMGSVRNTAVNLAADPSRPPALRAAADPPAQGQLKFTPPTVIPKPGPIIPWLDPLRMKRDTWEANGDKVSSCEEYVFEKYYEYTRFEDAVARAGLDDPRAAFNVAYGDASQSTSIGTLGVAQEKVGTWGPFLAMTVNGRNDVPALVQFPVAGLWPKNDFYSAPLPASSHITIESDPGGKDYLVIPPGTQSVLVHLGHLHRKTLSFVGTAFDDESLTAILQGTPKHSESWTWHQQMNQRNASVLDDVLYDFDERKRAFLLLLERRREMEQTIAASITHEAAPMAGTNKFQTRWWLDPIWNPAPDLTRQIAQVGVNVLNQTNANPYALPGAVKPLTTGFNQPSLPADSLPSVAPQVLSACSDDANPLVCMFYRLEAIDDAIESALQNAREIGCVSDPSSPTSGPLPCDWSPQTFASRVQFLFAQEREADFQKCEAATQDDFASLEKFTFRVPALDAHGVTQQVDYPRGVHDVDYTLSPQRLELFFQRQAEAAQEVLNFHHAVSLRLRDQFPNLIDPKTQALHLKRVEGDTYTLGGKWFGADAHWETGFEVKEIGNPNECSIRQHVWGDFTAKATVLKLPVELVDAHLNVTDEKLDRLNLTVAGEELIDPKIGPDNAIRFGADYDLVAPSGREKTATLAHYTQRFVIVFIPVSLGAYASGTLGFKYSVTAGRTEGETTEHKCKIARAEVRGSLEPYARVDGEIRAAVDAYVVSAGIKGILHVVRASVPVTAAASIGPNVDDPAQYDIQMRSGAELKMDFLSGQIDAYAEVCFIACKSAEATLVSWKGIQTTVPLFNIETTVPLFDLREIAGVTEPPAPLIAEQR